MRGIAANFIHTIIIQIPTIILGIFAGIFITRVLGPESKGDSAFILANVELFTLFLSVGIENGIVYFTSNNKLKKESISAIAILIYLAGFLIFSITLSVDYFLQTSFLFQKTYSFWIYLFMVFYFLLGVTSTYCSSFIRAYLNFKVINRITLFNSILNILVFSYLFYLQYQNPFIGLEEVFMCMLLILTLNVVIWIYFYQKIVKVKPVFKSLRKSDFYVFTKYNFIGYLGMLVNFFNYKLDLWFIGYYSNSKNLGLYSTAVNAAQFLLLFSRTLSFILQPYLSKYTSNLRLKTFIFYSKLNATIILITIAVLFPFGNFFIVTLFGNEFENSVLSFQILLVGMLFLCITQIFYIYFATSDRNDINLKANIFGLIICVVSNYILTSQMGIIGAAISSVICYFMIFLWLYFIYLLRIKNAKANIFTFVSNPIKELKELNNSNINFES